MRSLVLNLLVAAVIASGSLPAGLTLLSDGTISELL